MSHLSFIDSDVRGHDWTLALQDLLIIKNSLLAEVNIR